MTTLTLDDARAVLELDVQDHHRQQFGLVHGGVIAYLGSSTVCAVAQGEAVSTGRGAGS